MPELSPSTARIAAEPPTAMSSVLDGARLTCPPLSIDPAISLKPVKAVFKRGTGGDLSIAGTERDGVDEVVADLHGDVAGDCGERCVVVAGVAGSRSTEVA